jgi:hypothetical protein
MNAYKTDEMKLMCKSNLVCLLTEWDKEDARRARDLLLEEQRISGSVEEEGLNDQKCNC